MNTSLDLSGTRLLLFLSLPPEHKTP